MDELRVVSEDIEDIELDVAMKKMTEVYKAVDKLVLKAAKEVFGDHVTKKTIDTLSECINEYCGGKYRYVTYALFGVPYVKIRINTYVFEFTFDCIEKNILRYLKYEIINPEINNGFVR